MVSPNTSTIIQMEINIKNNILAILAAPASIFVNPKIPAIIATIKNINDHFSINLGLSCNEVINLIISIIMPL